MKTDRIEELYIKHHYQDMKENSDKDLKQFDYYDMVGFAQLCIEDCISNQAPKSSVKQNRSLSDSELAHFKERFDLVRKSYPGKKRGIYVEFINLFKKQHIDDELLNKMMTAVGVLVNENRPKDKYKIFQTWINNAGWEESLDDHGEALNPVEYDSKEGYQDAEKARKEKEEIEKRFRKTELFVIKNGNNDCSLTKASKIFNDLEIINAFNEAYISINKKPILSINNDKEKNWDIIYMALKILTGKLKTEANGIMGSINNAIEERLSRKGIKETITIEDLRESWPADYRGDLDTKFIQDENK
jgi:hypothetical protein